RLRVPVMVGVGAAFDFLSARKKQAPGWMREHGLEWLFRVLQEPRRLWRGYLVNGNEFVFLVAVEVVGLRRFGGRQRATAAPWARGRIRRHRRFAQRHSGCWR